MPLHEQAVAAKVLDACSRPFTAREIELILRAGKATRTQAEKLAGVLKRFTILAMVGPEQ